MKNLLLQATWSETEQARSRKIHSTVTWEIKITNYIGNYWFFADITHSEEARSSGDILSTFIRVFEQRISRKILIFSVWFIEQKVFLCDYMIYIRHEPTWLDPTLPEPTQPCPTWPGRNALWWVISQSVQKKKTWNFKKICSPILKMSYQNLDHKFCLVSKLYRFW